MYLSRVQLHLNRLKPEMLQKWEIASPYAAHQWLWQLFPEQKERNFLFRIEPKARFFVLSEIPPLVTHPLFDIETKQFNPLLENGVVLDFQIRANPVITSDKKRYDVMMHAKYQAKARGIEQDKWWKLQTNAACDWLAKQGQRHGFNLITPPLDEFACWAGEDDKAFSERDSACVGAYLQKSFQRKAGERPVRYSTVDFTGRLSVTDASRFQQVLFRGMGKSKALGCGLLMIKRPHV